jgi:hypothetical protein
MPIDTVPGSESSVQAPLKTNLCSDCMRSVDLNDAKAKSGTMDPEGLLLSFTEESHYERRDTMPGLDCLLASAKTGCGLCQFLRQEILGELESDDSWRSHPEIVLTFSYKWRRRFTESGRKLSLDELSVDITHPASGPVQVLSFHVSALPGKRPETYSVALVEHI